jgi:tetraacyldisaccharide 4'-kinase
VGNIPTGGTGKTPVVQWLANELRSRGQQPAILLRGYAAVSGHQSDEAQVLDEGLNLEGQLKIPVQPNPSRVQAAADVLRDHPQTTHFILDDGFQHRKARRDFNLVLISATQPFGYGHVLPRGLLREPLGGLARADAFLITRCSLVDDGELQKIGQFLADHFPTIPTFHCDHRQSAVWSAGKTDLIESLLDRKVFLTAGIGDPMAFEKQIASHGCRVVGTQWFPDHHTFSIDDINRIIASAKSAGAEMILTTAKDWVKMNGKVAVGETMPIYVVKLGISFRPGDEAKLIELVTSVAKRQGHPSIPV